MITAVDTNVLVDILEPDPRYGAASGDVLTRCLAEGTVVACDVVWAEVAPARARAASREVRGSCMIGSPEGAGPGCDPNQAWSGTPPRFVTGLRPGRRAAPGGTGGRTAGKKNRKNR